MQSFWIILAAVAVAVLFRLMSGSMDHDRIKDYITARGGKVTDARWVLFGPGRGWARARIEFTKSATWIKMATDTTPTVRQAAGAAFTSPKTTSNGLLKPQARSLRLKKKTGDYVKKRSS